MEIRLEDLAAKKAKSASGLVVSDHTLDLAKFTGSELTILGTGSRGLVLKNQKQVQITFKDFVLDMASDGVAVKFDGYSSEIGVVGLNAKIFGKAGDKASQLIYFLGVWNDIDLMGFELDQRRSNKAGATGTGACIQFAGVPIKSIGSLGSVYISRINGKNAGDEMIYVNHFKKIRDDGVEVADGEELFIESVTAENMGRDFGQQQGFRKATFANCSAKNVGLEANKDHVSGFSMNDGSTEEIFIVNCKIENAAQFIYGGSTKKNINARILNSHYIQGTHAGTRANSAMYLKGPGKYTLENCTIDAPNVLQAAITADGCQVEYKNCKFNSKDIDRLFNGGTVKEIPSVTTREVNVTVKETSLNGQVTTQYYLPDGREMLLKP